jgi:hypothetical protein
LSRREKFIGARIHLAAARVSGAMAINRGRRDPWGSTVAKLTRRAFLRHTPAGAAAIGLLPALPALPTLGHSRKAAASGGTATGPIVIHVKDPAAGEMTLFAGTRQVVLRDPGLVARFIEAVG